MKKSFRRSGTYIGLGVIKEGPEDGTKKNVPKYIPTWLVSTFLGVALPVSVGIAWLLVTYASKQVIIAVMGLGLVIGVYAFVVILRRWFPGQSGTRNKRK